VGQRRRARELAVQFLYQIDTTGEELELALEKFSVAFGLSEKAADFFLDLVRGVSQNRAGLDEMIQEHAHNWRLDRMSKVDRNILRLAAFELLKRPEIPAKVSINEAVDLGKRFGTDESGAFVNGVLDAIRLDIESRGTQCES